MHKTNQPQEVSAVPRAFAWENLILYVALTVQPWLLAPLLRWTYPDMSPEMAGQYSYVMVSMMWTVLLVVSGLIGHARGWFRRG
jgi:hypothetical protein